MVWLILGLLLWAAMHMMKRIAPAARAQMGDAGKAVVAVGLLAAIVLMVIGYRAADPVPLWDKVAWAVRLNNLLMVFSVILFGVGMSKSRFRGRLRHPMLTGALVWAVAHLLVNGDVPSLVLFGGLGLWAAAEMVLINRAEPAPAPFTGGTVAGDLRLIGISAAVFTVIVLLHVWIGPSPFAV